MAHKPIGCVRQLASRIHSALMLLVEGEQGGAGGATRYTSLLETILEELPLALPRCSCWLLVSQQLLGCRPLRARPALAAGG